MVLPPSLLLADNTVSEVVRAQDFVMQTPQVIVATLIAVQKDAAILRNQFPKQQ